MSRARARTRPGSIPVASAVASGGNGATSSRRSSAPAAPARAAASSSDSANVTCSSERSSFASESGRSGRCSNSRAVSDRRGSTTTTRPPRAGDRVELILDPRRAHHRAVRDQRVRPDDEQQLGPLEVGDRQQERRSVEQRARREPVRDVLGGGRVVVPGAERVEEALDPERVRVAEGARVAHVPADRLSPVLALDGAEPLADLVERGLPVDPLVAPVRTAALRMQDPVGIVLDLGHRDPLRAREPPRQRMLLVGAELRDAAVADGGDHPAERLADPAVGDVLGDAHCPVLAAYPGRGEWRTRQRKSR